ncbi:hypothetical protein CLCR_06339 [Cladophialophora carrionii]|uniref:Uncharacterized protein n=1 Tax=Cladophialophora carrionii TaxID=86049 RepID=A0A1C1C811_9EURO|nr:hypothetical protein CLCR_06339 [Cladophialophora carrionii]
MSILGEEIRATRRLLVAVEDVKQESATSWVENVMNSILSAFDVDGGYQSYQHDDPDFDFRQEIEQFPPCRSSFRTSLHYSSAQNPASHLLGFLRDEMNPVVFDWREIQCEKLRSGFANG